MLPEIGVSESIGRWEQVNDPGKTWLMDLDMLSSELGWAVGANGTILKYDAGKWLQVESPTTSNLTSIVLLSPVEGWAVGNQPVVFLHLTDGKWRLVEKPIEGAELYGSDYPYPNPIRAGGLFALDYFDDDRLMAVGGRLTLNDWATIIHFNDSQYWTTVIEKKQPFSLLDISLRRDGSGWAVGDGVALAIAAGGSVPNEPQPIEIEATLTAVEMVGPEEAWAVGTAGALALYQDGEWRLLELGWDDIDFYDLAMTDEGEGWAVGTHGTIIHFDKEHWQLYRQQHPLSALLRPITLTAIDMISSEEGWAVGTNGALFYYTH